ncbi:diguanylate cyclase/phosphodiesterase [Motilibacter rhizosphaerae]|uniref:Diguanylate cyclase/phosphodiesterase n=1 Tax=Motilibacter rhizosphaerae TaxID=598652 RepID=A0A4Q7NTL8_9ACTN|nr:bifunctional diguanylate cyclase/phosphodiesterase [Motilibacter rhizosphaerae]RZS90364.1 diguanylate cyclase/phosphodiesterase [Motilibacter rhizosphaerae]
MNRRPASAPAERRGAALVWLVWLVLGAACVAALPLEHGTTASDLHFDAVTVLSVAVGAAALARRRGADLLPWALVVGGLALQSAGEFVWSWHDIVIGDEPFPSVGDAFFLGGTGALLAAAVSLGRRAARGRAHERGRSPLAEVGVVALAGALLSWQYVLGPTAAEGTEHRLAWCVSVAYPVLDLVILAALARLGFEGGGQGRPVLLLGGALCCQLAADVGFALQDAAGTYAEGGWVDCAWLATYVLGAAAVLHPQRGQQRASAPLRVVTARRLAVVLVCGAVGPALLCVGSPDTTRARLVAGSTVVVLALVLLRTVTVLRAYETSSAQLAHSTLHDALTGLANRGALVRRLEHALDDEGATGRRVAVLRLDLDGFSGVNDLVGPSAGDGLLVRLAARLREVAPEGSLLARIAGDEFALLVGGADEAEVAALAERLLEAVRRPFAVPVPDGSTQELWIRASVGTAGAQPGESTVDALLGAADAALALAKNDGGGRCVAHSPELDGARLHLRPLLAARLEHALEADELEVHYQPLVLAADGHVAGFEALVRWRRDGVLVPPGEFLPAAHAAGLMPALDRQVLRRAVAQLARWRDQAGGEDLHVSVNVSVRTWRSPGIVEEVLAELAHHDVPAPALLLEVTEETAAADPGVRGRLAEVREAGVRVALDDFGTGYSALAYLETLPADVLKIAKELVDPIADGRSSRVVGALVDLAHACDLQVIAEGVETASQRDRLVASGVDVLQGYLFARPLPADEAERLWRAARRPAARTAG